MIGLVSSMSGGDPNAVTAPWGGDISSGNDARSALGFSALTRPQQAPADDSAPAPTVDQAPDPAPQGPFPALPAPVQSMPNC